MALCDKLETARVDREARRDRLVAASLHRLQTAPSTTEETADADEHALPLPAAARFHLDHLTRLVNRPEHVKQLRQTILYLAVRGKLVEQDPGEEPATDFIRRVQEKALIIQGRPGKAVTANSDGSLPIPLPSGWAAANLSGLGLFVGGKTPSKNRSEYWEGSIPWVTPKDMKALEVFGSEDRVTDLALRGGLALVPAGSVLIVVRSGILRRTVPVAVAKCDCTINQDLKALVPFYPEVSSAYLQLLVRGFEGFILSELTKTGTTVESMKFGEFSSQPFPIPPVQEQQRILAKVDQLMALCDQLEAQLIATEADSRRLLEAVLRDALKPALAESEVA